MIAGSLSLGQHGPLHVREERLISGPASCRLLYVSDIHLRPQRSDFLCRQVIDAIRGREIDALLLGGDLVDTASELGALSGLVRELRKVAPVFAIGGNHDEYVGIDRVEAAVVAGDGQWIHATCAHLFRGRREIVLAGPKASLLPEGHVRVLCAHNPRIWKTARKRGFDLVLAGHLHGCQFVAFEYRDRLYPGALFYPYCYLNHQEGSARLIVSRGVSDLFPVRWGCPREVVLCHV